MPNVFRDEVDHILAVSPVLKANPQFVTAIAQTPGTTDEDIKAVAGTMEGVAIRNWLQGLPEDRREQEWGRLTNENRLLAASAGYSGSPTQPSSTQQVAPPPEKNPVERFLGGVWGGVKSAGGKARDVLSWGTDQIHHAQRTGMEVVQRRDDPDWLQPIVGLSSTVAGFAGVLGKGEIGEAWRATADGDKSFDWDALESVRHVYDRQTFELAKKIAENPDMMRKREDVLKLASSPEEAAAWDNMLHNPILQEAISAINSTKLSLGRQTAQTLGLRHDDLTGDGGNWGNKAFTVVSGLFDGVNTFFLDPLIVGSKITSTVKAARYGLGAISPSRIDELFEAGKAFSGGVNVRRFWDGAVPHINAIAKGEDAAAIGKSYEQLQVNYRQAMPMLNSLVDFTKAEGKELTTDGVRDFLKNTQNLQALMRGESAYRGALMPHKGVFADAIGNRVRDNVKRAGIRWMENPSQLMEKATVEALDDLEKLGVAEARGGLFNDLRKNSIRYRAGMTFGRLVEQSPIVKNGKLDLLDDNASKVVYNLSRTYLPRWFSNTVAGAFAGADLAGKKKIYRGLVTTVAEAAGIRRTEVGEKWLTQFLSNLDDSIRGYSPVKSADNTPSGMRAALYPEQMSVGVEIPSFREMHNLASRVGILSHLGAAVTPKVVDRFMTGYWRPSVLLRPALILRNALEQDVLHWAKNGVFDFAKGARVSRKMERQVRRLEREGMTNEIGEMFQSWRGLLLSKDDKKFLSEVDDSVLEMFKDGSMDTARRAMTYEDATEVARPWQNIRAGDVQMPMSWRNSGDYTDMDVQGLAGARRWAIQLQTRAEGRFGQIVLENIADQKKAVDELSDYILSPEFSKMRNYSERWRELVKIDPSNEVVKLKAAKNWADAVYKDMYHHVSDSKGNLLSELVDDIRKVGDDGFVHIDPKAITTERLNKIDRASRPASVVSTELVGIQKEPVSVYMRAVNWGFEQTGKWTSKISNNPILWSNYLDARKGMQAWSEQLVDDFYRAAREVNKSTDPKVLAKLREQAEESARKIVSKQSMEAALDRTLAFVDNPDVRTNAHVILRNAVPFGRAQEEFYRRWARVMKYSPEAIRKMQMVFEGAVDNGMVRYDEDGNAMFVYPGSRLVQGLMYGIGKKFGWESLMNPVPTEFSSQIRFLNQGADPKNVQPSLGPIAAMPLKFIEAINDDSYTIKQLNRVALGDQGASTSLKASLFPSFFRRVWESGVLGNETEQLAAATKQSMIYMDVAGRTPPEGADPVVMEDYLQDVKKWAKVQLFMRALFGSVVPATPSSMGSPSTAPIGGPLDPAHPENDPGVFMSQHRLIDQFRRNELPNVAAEFRADVARLGDYNLALADWIKSRPEQLPFAAGMSQAKYGGYVPATEKAGQFFDSNKDLFKDFPAAAVMFLPQDKTGFDMDVYRSQLASGLRERKDMETFARDLNLTGWLQRYYDMKEEYAGKIADAKARGAKAEKTALDAQWKSAAELFKSTHPAVKQYLADYAGRAKDRETTLNDLRRMIDSGRVPNIPGRQAIIDLVKLADWREDALSEIVGRTKQATAARDAIGQEFLSKAKQLVGNDPNADMVYQRLFRTLEEG